jgi:predicted nucleotidyltransferase component of viral defense system
MRSRVLTGLQQRTLDGLFGAELGERGFYLTGGTALSAYYLEHRYSDDLDLFTRDQGQLTTHFDFASRWLVEQEYELVSTEVYESFARLFVRDSVEPLAAPLKIEFARDVPARMAVPRTVGHLIVDSLEDIAVNKVCAIAGREPPECKDYVDLDFILQDAEFSLDYLLARAREKEAMFDSPDGVLVFATKLLAVENLTLLPRMIRPMDMQTLQGRIVPLAEELIRGLRRGPAGN